MSYEWFAKVYDRLMEEVPYDEWAKWAEKELLASSSRPSLHLLDLGCGTGEMTLRLQQAGHQLVGIDLSAEMLTVAQEKADMLSLSPLFLQQNIVNLEGFSNMDGAVMMCDVLNYVTDSSEIRQLFKRVAETLAPGGLLLFDVHTPYKIRNIFADETFAFAGDEASYIWECTYEEPDTVTHDVTFFVQQENGMYERWEETHVQRAYELTSLRNWLEEAGFVVVSVSSGPRGNLSEDSERAFFVARKKSGDDK